MRPLNLALVVEEAAGIRLLRKLKASEHAIRMVASSPRKMKTSTAWRVAKSLGLPAIPARNVKDPSFANVLKELDIDLLVSFRSPYLIHDAVIDAPRIGAYNLHTGPLPGYAGRNVISWAIYNGETTHGVTLHELTSVIDGGDIAYESRFNIGPEDTAFSLTAISVSEGLRLVMRLIDQAAAHPAGIPHKPQAGIRHYFDKRIPQQGRIDWSRPASSIVNFVRACAYYPFESPWGYPVARIGGGDAELLKVTQQERPYSAAPGTLDVADEIYVACSDNWVKVEEILLNGESVPAREHFSE